MTNNKTILELDLDILSELNNVFELGSPIQSALAEVMKSIELQLVMIDQNGGILPDTEASKIGSRHSQIIDLYHYFYESVVAEGLVDPAELFTHRARMFVARQV